MSRPFLCYNGHMSNDSSSDVKLDKPKGRQPLFMQSGRGYSTRLEVHFSKEAPYQMVDDAEVEELLAIEGKFRLASVDEIKSFYGL